MDVEMNELISVTMNNIKSMMDSENVIGRPISMTDGSVILPVSKVTVGFVTGGGQYRSGVEKAPFPFPFAGGGGGGINITPIGFLSYSDGGFSMIKIDKKESAGKWDSLISAVSNMFKGKK